jgi:hypothetical protein
MKLELKRRGTELVLVNPSENLLDMLEMLGLAGLVRIAQGHNQPSIADGSQSKTHLDSGCR